MCHFATHLAGGALTVCVSGTYAGDPVAGIISETTGGSSSLAGWAVGVVATDGTSTIGTDQTTNTTSGTIINGEQYTQSDDGVLTGSGAGTLVSDGYANSQVPSSSYSYTNNGSYTNSGSTGVATLTSSSSVMTTSSATEPFTTSDGTAIASGTLSSNASTSSSTLFSSATSYTPSTTSVTFNETITGSTSTGVSNNDSSNNGQGGTGTYNGTSSSTNQTTNTTSGTVINGTSVATNVYEENGTSGYTDSSSSISQSPGLSFSSSSSAGGGASWGQSATTTSTTSPQGSLVTLYQNFGSTQAASYTASSANVESTNNVNSGTITMSSRGSSSGDSYSSSFSDGGTASGSGTSIVLNAAYSLAQALSGYIGRSNMNYQGWSTSLDQSVTSSASTNYTTYSAAYGESGSTTGTQAMPVTNLGSSSFNVSSTNVATNNTLSSSVLTTYTSGGQGSPTFTLIQTMNSTYTGSTTTSMIASGTTSDGASNATVSGGSSGWFSGNYTIANNGAGNQTIDVGSTTSSYTDTYSNGGATFTGGVSWSSTLTTSPGSVTSASWAMSYSDGVSGIAPPTVTSLLGSIGVEGSGSSAGSSGAGASGSAGGSSSTWGSSSGSSGLAGSSSSSGSPSSSSGSPTGPGSNTRQIAAAINAITASSPAAAGVIGQIFVPGGVVTLPGPAISSGAGVTSAADAGLVAVNNADAASILPPMGAILATSLLAGPRIGGPVKDTPQMLAIIAQYVKENPNDADMLKVYKNLQKANASEMIRWTKIDRGNLSGFHDHVILLNDTYMNFYYKTSGGQLAWGTLRLVHEAVHLIDEVQFGEGNSIAEEEKAWSTELRFYDWLRKQPGYENYKDVNLEAMRERMRKNETTLRQELQKSYTYPLTRDNYTPPPIAPEIPM